MTRQDRTWSLDWRTMTCSPACSYPGECFFVCSHVCAIIWRKKYKKKIKDPFWRKHKKWWFVGAAIAGSINPVKFYYNISEYLFIYLFIYLFTYLFIYLFIYWKNEENFQNCVSFNGKERCMITNLVMKVKNAEHLTRFTF